MKKLLQRTRFHLRYLEKCKRAPIEEITGAEYYPCEYKSTGELPDPSLFVPYDTENDRWGTGTDSHAWFRFRVNVPAEFDPETVYVNVTTDSVTSWDVNNPQFIVYVDGKQKQGLDINHTEIFFDRPGEHEVYLYAYTGSKVKRSQLGLALCRVVPEVEKLWYDIKVPFDSLEYLNEYGMEYAAILEHLNRALLLLDMLEIPSEAFYRSARSAGEYMDTEFYGKFCSPPAENSPVVVGIGHTHIDCAWLWTLRQTREKVQRSFSTVIELMRRFPEYRFMSSQAFLYKNLKEESPEIYEEVRRLIKEGRWECEGAMWVEADCNLPSGESLIRQIMYGKRFFREEFGTENRVLWLPDVFGYSAALPQILKKSGIDWFVTSKISWNETNQMPYDTFLWKGIDGTGINTYFLTAQDKEKDRAPNTYTTYVAHITPAMVAGTHDRYQQKGINPEALITFGYGDGGGGSTAKDLETARRLSKGIPGTPALKIGFAGDFLSRLEKRIENNPRLPVWKGELYLERHRGTYTSMGKVKKENRRCEELYLNTEFACTVEKLFFGKKFPKKALREGWEMILTNQFHDIIPGSSIFEVYEQTDKDYAVIRETAAPHLENARKSIAKGIAKTRGDIVFNPNPTAGEGIVKKNGKSVFVSGIPAKGYSSAVKIKSDNAVKVGTVACESKFFRLEFDKDMLITSIWDKPNSREVLKKSAYGNELRVYEDFPNPSLEAWEWDDTSMQKHTVIRDVSSVEPVTDGVRAGLKITRKHMKSLVVQKIWLYDDIDRIDFETYIDWQERHQLLKAAFEVDINADRATYEIQYGTTERPTHKNTSWDMAKYEVCGHRFADLSEGSYGVSLLNDCKYGYDIHDGLMTLTLLKSAANPNPEADLGEMNCTYSLHPHKGAADICKLYTMAYGLNNPMTLLPADGESDLIPAEFSAVSCADENILCEVVKEAESGEELIFRFFECANAKTQAKLSFGFNFTRAQLCGMEENPMCDLAVNGRELSLEFGAFEIHTLKITL